MCLLCLHGDCFLWIVLRRTFFMTQFLGADDVLDENSILEIDLAKLKFEEIDSCVPYHGKLFRSVFMIKMKMTKEMKMMMMMMLKKKMIMMMMTVMMMISLL